MAEKPIICDGAIDQALINSGWTSLNVHQGHLMLTELLIKANAGYYNSHTEELFMSEFGLLKKDRTLTKPGRKYIAQMMYAPSNRKSDFVRFSEIYRGE